MAATGTWDGWGVTSQGTQILGRLLCCSAGADVSLFHAFEGKCLQVRLPALNFWSPSSCSTCISPLLLRECSSGQLAVP